MVSELGEDESLSHAGTLITLDGAYQRPIGLALGILERWSASTVAAWPFN